MEVQCAVNIWSRAGCSGAGFILCALCEATRVILDKECGMVLEESGKSDTVRDFVTRGCLFGYGAEVEVGTRMRAAEDGEGDGDKSG